MVHELLSKGEKVQYTFGNNVFITDKRLIKTNRESYFEDLNLDAIEGVELKISHYEILLRIGSSLMILYGLLLVLSSVAFVGSLGINLTVVTNASLICAIAFLVTYFIARQHSTKVYGANKTMLLAGHDWDVVSTLRHHVFEKQNESAPKTEVKKKK